MFRYIQLPKMRGVLTIAMLLRFMDSFLIYTEPFVLTGGGPGDSTTFLSIYLVKIAVGEFDVGTGGGLLDHLLPDRPGVQLRLLPGAAPGRHEEKRDENPTRASSGSSCYLIVS